MIVRRRLRVRGTVQGVGFRPFVYGRATALGIAGQVGNDGEGVLIEAEGEPASLDRLHEALLHEAPPLAIVEAVEVVDLAARGDRGFRIAPSTPGRRLDVPVSADVAPCARCVAEMADPRDRRFRYPFINCTDCGPRYTIMRRVPYDRPATTMAAFRMCGPCREEYTDPASRRFHAQPNACPQCGPRLSWSAGAAPPSAGGEAALAAAVACVRAGGVVAVKGVGGYHLCCDAGDARAVATLRRRKARDDKPFALMAGDLATAEALCELSDPARALLVSPRRPIVLAPRRSNAAVAAAVAPGLRELGVMLPPSPLHLLLAGDLGRPLVMTSGNRTDEPTVHLDQQAVDRLADIADGILAHDRAIEVRVDDSVVRASAGGRVQVLRRSRGWVPQPLRLPTPAVEPILAVGAELKNTVAVARGPDVVVGHHLGDLRHWAAYESFLHAVGHLPRLSGVQPTVIAHDLHPEYLSTKWALEQDARRVAVQHHHAHLAACLVEHGRADPVVGIVFDGAGFGLDGTLWGGEFLLGSLGEARRVGQLAAVVLPGGDTAVRQPWRMAVSWLWAALPAGQAAEHARELDPRWRGVLALVEAGHGVATSSVGRLFDAVAALLHVAHTVTYEGQAAIALEELAATATRVRRYRIDCPDRVLDPRPLLRALLRDRQAGIPAADIAAGFHAALARASAELAAEIAAAHAVDTVALCGGVFANVLLSDLLARELHRRGLQVLSHASLPPGDGSISVGQAAVAAARGTADRSPAPPAHPPATEASAPS